MSASLPPGKPNPSGRNSILGLAAVGVVFLAGVIGVSVWVVKSFVSPKQEVIILPTTAAPLPAPRAVAIAPQANPPSQQVREQLARATIAAAVAEMHPIFTGKVFDAQTHQAVDGVIAMVGYSQAANQPVNYVITALPERTVQPGGGYRVMGSQVQANSLWYVRVQAHGYEPAVSAPQRAGGTVDFELTPAKDITGIVYGSDDKPAADVTVGVALAGGASSVSVTNGTLSARSGLQVRSGADGSYSFWPETGDFTMVAASPTGGLAIVSADDFAKSSDIHLSAWGGVQGQVLFGSKPGAGASVFVQSAPSSGPVESSLTHFAVTQTAKADADGHFTLDFVKPGRNQLSHRVEQTFGPKGRQRTSIWNTQITSVAVEAGKILTANIGGGGRPVIGKLDLPPIPKNAPYIITIVAIGQAEVSPIPQMPDEIKNATSQARLDWMHIFAQTAEGRAYLVSHPADMPMPVTYAPQIAEDGSYRIEDVHAGLYQMRITVQVPTGGIGTMTAHGSFTMPAITPELVDQPLEIPEIAVK